jgi:hypothetical protein
MKKTIEYIKDFYQTDREGLFLGIAITIFAYVSYCHIIPIILGL